MHFLLLLKFAGLLEANAFAIVKSDNKGILKTFLAELVLNVLRFRHCAFIAHSVAIHIALLVLVISCQALEFL